MIPAQTQLQTALSINLGSDGKAVSFSYSFFIIFIIPDLVLAHIQIVVHFIQNLQFRPVGLLLICFNVFFLNPAWCVPV